MIKDDNPKVIKEYEEVYFLYKPAYWNCVTDKDFTILYKKGETKLILLWIEKNLKIEKEMHNTKYNYGLLNRLDLETSGIVMVAKNVKSYEKYRSNINNHKTTTKMYIALVDGNVEHNFGIITLPLYMNRQKNVTQVDAKKGKFSYTEYVKLQKLIHDGKEYSLLLVKIKTGRTHQIRVHLKSIGHTVFCDKKYNPDKTKLWKECDISQRLFLHAYYYKIDKDIDSYVKIPMELDNTLNKMKIEEKYIETNNAFDILYSNTLTDTFINLSNIKNK